MASFLRDLLLFAVTFGAVTLVWRAASMEREATRRAPSASRREPEATHLSDEQQEMLLKELASHL